MLLIIISILNLITLSLFIKQFLQKFIKDIQIQNIEFVENIRSKVKVNGIIRGLNAITSWSNLIVVIDDNGVKFHSYRLITYIYI